MMTMLTIRKGINMQTWHIDSPLTMDGVPLIMRRYQRDTLVSEDWCIDLKAVDTVDSAGIAFLLSCIRLADEKGIQLQIQHLPAQVESLAIAQGVWEILKGSIH